MLANPPSPAVAGMPVTSAALAVSIVVGAALGHYAPDAGQWLASGVDHTLLVVVGLLFFGIRFGALLHAAGNLRFIAIALVTNFVLVPLVGYAVASQLLAAHPLFMVGLMIYFMSPCTDWFLSFTRLSGGNVALGTALMPLNMTAQLLLYPLYLQVFTHQAVQVEAGVIGDTLVQWFLVPLVLAIMLHQGLRRSLSPARFERLLRGADHMTPLAISLLVLQIFAANVPIMLEHRAVFGWVLLAVFVFFALTYVLGECVSRLFHLRYPEHALLTMTLAARNAPLMLAVTMAALPGQPLIYAALVVGMLLEFPHLTLLRRLLLGSRDRRLPHSATAATMPTGTD